MTRKPDELASAVEQNAGGKALPPLDQWNPGLLGDMDLLITRDGSWLFEGKPIGREAIVRLFCTILRKEQDGAYYLVTPGGEVADCGRRHAAAGPLGRGHGRG